MPDDIFTDRHRRARSSSCCACPTARSRCWSRASGARAIRRFTQTEGFFTVEIEELPDVGEKSVELDALMRSVHTTFENYVKLNKRIAPEILISVQTIDDPGQLADTIVGQLQLKLADKQAILEMDAPSKRLSRLYELMKAEIEILQVETQDPHARQEADGEDAEGVLPQRADAGDPEGAGRSRRVQERAHRARGARPSRRTCRKEAQAKVRKELKKLQA